MQAREPQLTGVGQMLNVRPRLVGSNRLGLALLRSRNVLFGALALVFILVIVVGAFGKSTAPQSLRIAGYVGHLGEWELTATLARDATGVVRELSGPLSMKHTGLCSQDGPEEKTGEMRMRLSRLSASVEARLLIDGVECTYSGTMSSSNRGKMVCPDRRSVPLTLWAE